jgi:hypothetical protein
MALLRRIGTVTNAVFGPARKIHRRIDRSLQKALTMPDL